MKAWFLIVVISVGTFISCRNNKTKNPSEILREAASDKDLNIGNLNFTFDLPQDWVRLDTVLQGLKITFLLPGHQTDNLEPRMNVSTEFMRGQAHEAYMANTKRYLANNIAGVELLNDGAIDVAGKKCLWNNYNQTNNGIKRQMVFYSIAISGISYNITAGVNDDGLQQYKPVFDQIIKSFKLVNK